MASWTSLHLDPDITIMTPGQDELPFWYKDAVIYETHIKAFFDANGDGYGDFEGLTHKLDYLVDLGVDAIWLLPFLPLSP